MDVKTNKEVLELVKEKINFLNNLKPRRRYMIDHWLKHVEELNNVIQKGLKERKQDRDSLRI